MPDERPSIARRSVATAVALALACVLLTPLGASAQDDEDVTTAMRFFLAGGAYCVRIAPEGAAMSDETEWTILLLTSRSDRRNSFKIRSLDRGSSELTDGSVRAAGDAVTGVWRGDTARAEFFARFAAAIERGVLRARVVKAGPADLAKMKPADRAEAYLKFADRGTRVSFDAVPDLSVDAFRQFVGYYPD